MDEAITYRTIGAIEDNARHMQALTLQDLLLSQSRHEALKTANPDDTELVELQKDRLAHQADNYRGAFLDNRHLVGYVKTVEAHRGDFDPFHLTRRQLGEMGKHTLFIAGLVVDQDLEETLQERVRETFVVHSLGLAALKEKGYAAVAMPDTDLLLPIVRNYGFEPLSQGRAALLPSLRSRVPSGTLSFDQTLYRRPIQQDEYRDAIITKKA